MKCGRQLFNLKKSACPVENPASPIIDQEPSYFIPVAFFAFAQSLNTIYGIPASTDREMESAWPAVNPAVPTVTQVDPLKVFTVAF
jgi:hypothetical protein